MWVYVHFTSAFSVALRSTWMRLHPRTLRCGHLVKKKKICRKHGFKIQTIQCCIVSEPLLPQIVTGSKNRRFKNPQYWECIYWLVYYSDWSEQTTLVVTRVVRKHKSLLRELREIIVEHCWGIATIIFTKDSHTGDIQNTFISDQLMGSLSPNTLTASRSFVLVDVLE